MQYFMSIYTANQFTHSKNIDESIEQKKKSTVSLSLEENKG